MPFDGIFLHHLIEELSEIHGQLIRKIYHPYPDIVELVLQFGCLSIGINPEFPYITYTKKRISPGNPADSFCMNLRKHLSSSKITEIKQLGCDRTVVMDLQKLIHTDSGPQIKEFKLIIMLAGKSSNVWLYFAPDRFISLRPFPYTETQQRLNPLECWDDIKKDVLCLDYESVINKYEGISRESYESLKNPDAEIVPCSRGNTMFSLSTAGAGTYDSFHSALLSGRNKWLVQLRKDSIARYIKKLILKAQRKVKICTLELEKCENHESVRAKADLLSTCRHLYKRGMTVLTCFDYINNTEVKIPVDPLEGINRTIEKLYKKARRAKRGQRICEQRLKDSRIQEEYTLELLAMLDVGEDLEALSVIEYEVLSLSLKKPPKKKELREKYRKFPIENGYAVVGRSCRENDHISFKLARKNDLWFHAKDLKGAHVILKTPDEITDSIIQKTAAIAAYYSKGKNNTRCEVIYTKKANLRKPKNAPAGLVTCIDYSVVTVIPALPQAEQ